MKIKELSSNTRSGSANAGLSQTAGAVVREEFTLARNMKNTIWINKNKASVEVELIAECELRFAETKKIGVIYSRNGILHVRSKAEFLKKFQLKKQETNETDRQSKTLRGESPPRN